MYWVGRQNGNGQYAVLCKAKLAHTLRALVSTITRCLDGFHDLTNSTAFLVTGLTHANLHASY